MPTIEPFKNNRSVFTKTLMDWHNNYNKRTMPWKGEKEPYKIWISEIILQQTRVMQALAYYNKFLEKFPNIKILANANDAEVFKTWEGLGYYSRCKNILFTARHIVRDFKGVFPTNYEAILKLKGVGPYTAAAISSFAYGLPHAVADGNVLRVLARYFGDSIPIDTIAGNKHYIAFANKLLYVQDPAAYNQAIMDFGATICKPKIAECTQCPLQKKGCIAYKKGIVNKLPIKAKKLKKSRRWFYYFVFVIGDEVLIAKRTDNDIWQSLYEFYLYEAYEKTTWNANAIDAWLKEQLGIKAYNIKYVSGNLSQQLTHQHLQGQVFVIEIKKLPKSLLHFEKVKIINLSLFPFPKFINQYLAQHPLQRTTASTYTISI